MLPTHTDDGHPRVGALSAAKLGALADGRFAGPETGRGVPIDLADERGADLVEIAEGAAFDLRRAQHAEVIGRDRDDFSKRGVLGAGGAAFDGDRARSPARSHGKAGTHGRGSDARQGTGAAQRFSDEDGAILHAGVWIIVWIVGLGKPDARHHRVVRVEAGVGMGEVPEAADEQAGARHEDEADGELGRNHSGGGQGLSVARSGAAAAFAQTAGEFDCGRLQRGGESERDASEYANGDGEDQYARVNANFGEARQAGRSEIEQQAQAGGGVNHAGEIPRRRRAADFR